jgi:hypothetical protein
MLGSSVARMAISLGGGFLESVRLSETVTIAQASSLDGGRHRIEAIGSQFTQTMEWSAVAMNTRGEETRKRDGTVSVSLSRQSCVDKSDRLPTRGVE